MNRLQRVLNAAARVTCHLPCFAHVTTALFRLHWLPIKYRILYKIALLTFKVFKGMAPSYLSDFSCRLRVTIHSEEIARYYSSPYPPNLRPLEIVPSLQPPLRSGTSFQRTLRTVKNSNNLKKSLKPFLFSLAYNCS